MSGGTSVSEEEGVAKTVDAQNDVEDQPSGAFTAHEDSDDADQDIKKVKKKKKSKRRSSRHAGAVAEENAAATDDDDEDEDDDRSVKSSRSLRSHSKSRKTPKKDKSRRKLAKDSDAKSVVSTDQDDDDDDDKTTASTKSKKDRKKHKKKRGNKKDKHGDHSDSEHEDDDDDDDKTTASTKSKREHRKLKRRDHSHKSDAARKQPDKDEKRKLQRQDSGRRAAEEAAAKFAEARARHEEAQQQQKLQHAENSQLLTQHLEGQQHKTRKSTPSVGERSKDSSTAPSTAELSKGSTNSHSRRHMRKQGSGRFRHEAAAVAAGHRNSGSDELGSSSHHGTGGGRTTKLTARRGFHRASSLHRLERANSRPKLQSTNLSEKLSPEKLQSRRRSMTNVPSSTKNAFGDDDNNDYDAFATESFEDLFQILDDPNTPTTTKARATRRKSDIGISSARDSFTAFPDAAFPEFTVQSSRNPHTRSRSSENLGSELFPRQTAEREGSMDDFALTMDNYSPFGDFAPDSPQKVKQKLDESMGGFGKLSDASAADFGDFGFESAVFPSDDPVGDSSKNMVRQNSARAIAEKIKQHHQQQPRRGSTSMLPLDAGKGMARQNSGKFPAKTKIAMMPSK